MPAIGRALLGVNGQHAALPGDGGVGFGERTQQLAESPLVGVGGVLLVAQEDDLVPEQCGAQLGHGGRADVTTDADAADDGTDHAAHLGDVNVLVRAMTADRMVLDAGHAKAPFGWLGLSSKMRRHPTDVKYSDRLNMK